MGQPRRDAEEWLHTAELHIEMCRVLSEPKRICLLYLIADGEKAVNELVEQTGFYQPTISRHLQILRQAGLVRTERRGTYIYYSLEDHDVLAALDRLRAVFARHAPLAE